ncbi:MAG: acyl-CoA thioesterase [Alphaproteobacteria bacterium]
MFTWDELRSTLHVERLDTYLFRGDSLSLGLKRVFGGQVLAQSLNAAARSVDADKVPHSMHGYFLRPGDFTRPIIFEVDPIRNGRSFSTRRVVARQNGEAIFNSSVSFHRVEDSPSHQIDMPEKVPSPSNVEPDAERIAKLLENNPHVDPTRLRSDYLLFPEDVIDLRSPFPRNLLKAEPEEPEHGFWFRVKADIGDDPVMHQTLLAYMSDKALMGTGIRPHSMSFFTHKLMGASLDHAMWFHTDVRVDEWLYYHLDSPRSGRARTFNRGSFYTESGELIASTAQEGLFRLIKE